jgi:hypothetical protein
MQISNKMNLRIATALAVIGLLAQAQAVTGPCNQKISDTQGGFTGILDAEDSFGQSVASLGDLDGDGAVDIAVGAWYDDDGGTDRGAVWILFLNPDKTVKSHQKISDTEGNFIGTLRDGDRFGTSVASLGDLNGDGITDIAVGANTDDDGGTDKGAVWILFLNTDGTVKSHQKISDTEGGFTGSIRTFDCFGNSVATLGDLDGDGVVDLAVGATGDDGGGQATDYGAVWILFLNANGTVKSQQKIGRAAGNFTGTLDTFDNFGLSVAPLGDLNRDGVPDLAVGAYRDDDGGTNPGAVWILFLDINGTVKSHQKISNTEGGFTGILHDEDYFGCSIASLGDVNEDGVGDIVVGAPSDDDGGTDRGAFWVLFLNTNGTVKGHQKISDTEGNFTGVLDDGDNFGASMTYLGDRNNNGIIDIAVGATGDDDGDSNKGAVWILFENVYYIDDDANDDPGPGDPTSSDPNENGSPEHPFDSIQKALDDAAAGDCNCATVIVRDGVYSGAGNYDIDPCGLAVAFESQNGPDYSIIDCNDQGRAFIFHNGEDADTILAGLTITGGDSGRDDYACKSGGAIYCNGTSPTIRDCTIIGNYALWSGGAIYVGPNSSSLIEQCRIIFNYCDVAAGGIYSYMSEPVIKNCLLADNFGYWSGAISSNGYSNSTIINCTIADNFALDGPSGIECYYYTNATVINSILWNTDNDDEQIYLEEAGAITVDYSNVQMADGNTWDGNNINTEPLFAIPHWFDYHLKSTAGRWTPFFETNGDFNNDGVVDFFDFAMFALTWRDTGAGMPTDFACAADNVVDYKDLAVLFYNWLAPGLNVSGWVSDSVTSPCIDAGDPNSDYSQEPIPNGGRINMGAYGNTGQASKSPY